MSSLAHALVGQVLGHSDAEKAFRPWWDNFEDQLIYGLILLGMKIHMIISTLGSDLRVWISKNGQIPE